MRFVNQRRRCAACAAATLADEITGNLITYDNIAEVFSVAGGAAATPANPGGRVRAVLTPREGRARRGRSRRAQRRLAAARASGAERRRSAVEA